MVTLVTLAVVIWRIVAVSGLLVHYRMRWTIRRRGEAPPPRWWGVTHTIGVAWHKWRTATLPSG